MSIEIKIPALGESITGGVLSEWLKKNGDVVKDEEPLFMLETDKISSEIPSPGPGRLVIKVEPGSEVKVGDVVGSIEAVPAGAAEATPAAAAPSDAVATAPATPSSAPTAAPAAQQKPAAETGGQTLPPSVRRLAEEEKVPLERVSGTGKHGQITKTDVIDFLEKRASGTAPAPAPATPAPSPARVAAPAPATKETGAGATAEGRVTRRKLSPLRKKIAAQLVMAQQNAAMLTTFNECDMSAVMSLRSKYQESFQKRHGIKLGFMSFFIKAVVDALQSVPAINARMEGDDLIENHYYDIGVAVGTPRGLVVPVVRIADQKGFAELEKEVAQYASRARDGKLQLDDLMGGVFTITNGGIYGSLLSTPILNPPQSGILGMHKIQNRPVAIGDKVEVRPMMYLALSYDHRVVDGKEAVTFLVRVKDCIEDPTRLLLQG
jgi:2-oxoglutarate dehydrogenase E2 component (dihydrolipoamide succinyltransferase)